MKHTRLHLLFFTLLFACALPVRAWAELRVVASLPTLAALAAEVGGANVTVTALAQAGEDPHFVDSRPNFVVALSRADLLVLNGLELEASWLSVVTQQARNPDILPGARGHFDASNHVRLLDIPTGTLDRSMGDVHPGGNPHFLVDPRAAASIVTALGERMATLDPPNANTYRSNAARVASELSALAQRYSEQFGALDVSRRQIVEYHASFTYLNDWLGLSRAASIEPRPGVPPDPGHVATVRATVADRNIRAIVQEAFYPATTAQTLAAASGGRVVIVSAGADFARGETYTAWISGLVEDLYDALAAN